ncbi:MAG: hypothetical protein PHC61_05240 [Chitinivibrionales bacterium]|nr:hypothetical protein [Chitinivibrionales bacterium]
MGNSHSLSDNDFVQLCSFAHDYEVEFVLIKTDFESAGIPYWVNGQNRTSTQDYELLLDGEISIQVKRKDEDRAKEIIDKIFKKIGNTQVYSFCPKCGSDDIEPLSDNIFWKSWLPYSRKCKCKKCGYIWR